MNPRERVQRRYATRAPPARTGIDPRFSDQTPLLTSRSTRVVMTSDHQNGDTPCATQRRPTGSMQKSQAYA
jgi:hypothetical protein